MDIFKLKKSILWSFIWIVLPILSIAQAEKTGPIDDVAEKVLLYQRENGGWPQYGGNATDYRNSIDDSFKVKLMADKGRKDTNIDDGTTTFEINYLLTAFQQTQNETYLKAAKKGIAYLLEAQNEVGGWPQFYPDTSKYRKHITYNDNAMINVLWIMKKLAENDEAFEPVSPELKSKAATALQQGIKCILNTQFKQNGKLTTWCAQYDSYSLAPAKARAFEPASLSGKESVEIVRFLMSINQPTEEIKVAIQRATEWFEQVKIPGINIKTITDTTQSSGKDRVIYQDSKSTLWARFYDLETNQPLFTGRDGEPKASLEEIENERRIGYGYYGEWPQKLLKKEYPKWMEKW